MNSIKTANILLIVLLVLILFKIVWDFKFAKAVADEVAIMENEKATGQPNNEEKKTDGFFGTRKIARKLSGRR